MARSGRKNISLVRRQVKRLKKRWDDLVASVLLIQRNTEQTKIISSAVTKFLVGKWIINYLADSNKNIPVLTWIFLYRPINNFFVII